MKVGDLIKYKSNIKPRSGLMDGIGIIIGYSSKPKPYWSYTDEREIYPEPACDVIWFPSNYESNTSESLLEVISEGR